MSHDLRVQGASPGTGMLAPGQRQTVDCRVFGHTEQARCTVATHQQAGMVLTITVAAAAPGMDGRSTGVTGGTASPAARDAAIDPAAQPGKGWHPFDRSLARPGDQAKGAVQTLGLMPGEGEFAEFTAPAAGHYEMLDHHPGHAAGDVVASVS